MTAAIQYDVIIVGSGAGGGTLAHALAPTGKKILILERGDWLTREKDNWDTRAVFTDGKYKTKEVFRGSDGPEFHPGTHYCVGGNTKMYGAALLRFRREDFGEIHHHGGISPAWPIHYEDLEPYYNQAEHLYCVHGTHGIDPTEPPAAAEYRFRPVSHEARIQQLHNDLVLLGYKPFPLPIGIMLDEQEPQRSRCIRCNTCDGFPCLVQAKADAEVVSIRPALEWPNVTLLTNARVDILKTNSSGTAVTSVIVDRNGFREEFRGDVVVVSCGAINSAVLLLKSDSDAHPRGLANSSGVVGRHYMCHNNSAMLAISKEPNQTQFQKTLGLNDFYFGSEDFNYPMGHIQTLGKANAEMLKGDAPSFAPEMALDMMAGHSLDFWLTSEDLPDSDNRVTVDRDGTVTLHYSENNLEGHARLKNKLKELLSGIGCDNRLMPCSFYLGKKIPIAGVAHQCGTIRFGDDARTSALDANCKAHDLDNLYVVDGSFFVSSSATNPALTIMANALRVADHLKKRLT
jgi:choline dehydrogenase-like flavoprotein